MIKTISYDLHVDKIMAYNYQLSNTALQEMTQLNKNMAANVVEHIHYYNPKIRNPAKAQELLPYYNYILHFRKL